MRTLADGLMLPAGSNVLRWDGRNRDGQMVQEGIYVISIEALGDTQTKTLAVVP
jgi:flagellar hook assembly protein FlgD